MPFVEAAGLDASFTPLARREHLGVIGHEVMQMFAEIVFGDRVSAIGRAPRRFAQGDECSAQLGGEHAHHALLMKDPPDITEQITFRSTVGVVSLFTLKIGHRRTAATVGPVPVGE